MSLTPRGGSAAVVPLASLAVVLSIGVGVGVSGCSDPGIVYADELAKRSSDGGSFTLPQAGAPVSPWIEVAVLCPYGSVGELPDGFRKAAAKIDTNSDDGVQWLLFRSKDRFGSVRLERADIDFCSTGTVSGEVFDAQTEWTAHEQDGGRVLLPVGDA